MTAVGEKIAASETIVLRKDWMNRIIHNTVDKRYDAYVICEDGTEKHLGSCDLDAPNHTFREWSNKLFDVVIRLTPMKIDEPYTFIPHPACKPEQKMRAEGV